MRSLERDANNYYFIIRGGEIVEKFKTWIKAAGVRAVKTVAQTAVATIGTAAIFSAVDWQMVVSAALLAGVLSLLTSIAGLPEIKAEDE